MAPICPLEPIPKGGYMRYGSCSRTVAGHLECPNWTGNLLHVLHALSMPHDPCVLMQFLLRTAAASVCLAHASLEHCLYHAFCSALFIIVVGSRRARAALHCRKSDAKYVTHYVETTATAEAGCAVPSLPPLDDLHPYPDPPGCSLCCCIG